MSNTIPWPRQNIPQTTGHDVIVCGGGPAGCAAAMAAARQGLKSPEKRGLPQNLWVLKACSYPIRGTF